MTFKYELEDVEKFPGLTRPWETGVPYLTPVYFDKNVLGHYFYIGGYTCQLCSETYGAIEGEGFSLSFGINPNGRIIAWLGDLEKLPERERLRFLAENIASDGDIRSEFYDGQINCDFTEPIAEITILNDKYKANNLIHSHYGKFLYSSSKPRIDDLINSCSKYKRIMFDNEDDFKRFVSDWNEALVEDLAKDNLREILRSGGINPQSDHGELKLLESFLVNLLGDSSNIIAPLFYLYDLRIWADHRGADKKYRDVCEKLELNPEGVYKDLYNALMQLIGVFFANFNSLLKTKGLAISG